MSFWGHILAKKGQFGPKWAEFPYSSKGKLFSPDPAPQGPYIASKGLFWGDFHGIGLFRFNWGNWAILANRVICLWIPSQETCFQGYDIPKKGIYFWPLPLSYSRMSFWCQNRPPLKRSKMVKMTYFGVKTRGPRVPFGQKQLETPVSLSLGI